MYIVQRSKSGVYTTQTLVQLTDLIAPSQKWWGRVQPFRRN